MIAIELSPEEVRILRTTLEARLNGMIFEIDHTDARAYRDELRRQSEIVEKLLTRLPPTAARAAS
jgi:hypothetical protein